MHPRGPNLFVACPNSWFNKGDTNNRLGMLLELQRELGSATQVVMESLTPKQDSEYFGPLGARIITSIYSKNQEGTFRIPSKLQIVVRILVFAVLVLAYKLSGFNPSGEATTQRFFSELVEADIVISAPGGFLQDHEPDSTLLPNLLVLYASHFLGKPIIVYAQSIGPFRNVFLRLLSSFILNRAKLIILREPISKLHMEEAGIDLPPTYITADASFSVEPEKRWNESLSRMRENERFAHSSKPTIGISIIGEFFLRRNRYGMLESYIDALSKTIDYVIGKHGYNAIIVPQVATSTEFMVAEMVKRRVVHQDSLVIVAQDMAPEEIMSLIGTTDAFIGTRMHSNIFALITHTPVIAIAYQHKTSGIMEALDLSEWSIPIGELTDTILIDRVTKLLNNHVRCKRFVIGKVEEIRRKSRMTAKIVRRYIEKTMSPVRKS